MIGSSCVTAVSATAVVTTAGETAGVRAPALGRWQATALALSFVVGSGILVLPVLSLSLAGPTGSLYAWILMTLIGIPLVLVFYKISLTHDFTLTQCFTRSFGPATTLAANLTILGALLFGMPAMVYTTSGVITRLLHLPEYYIGATAHVLLTVLCLNHLRPLKQSSKLSLYSAGFLMLLIGIAVGTHTGDLKTGAALPLNEAPRLDLGFLHACALTFFGYVGWESLGFFTNELENPQRDLKYVFGISFIVVSVFYLALSAVISGAAHVGATFNTQEGFLSLLPQGLIRTSASIAISVLLVANLNAWVFGGKKQMQEVLSPQTRARTPLTLYYIASSALLVCIDLKWVSLADLFLLSNQNWIVVYAGILAYYFRVTTGEFSRAIGVIGSLSVLILLSGCSRFIVFNVAFFIVSILLHRRATIRASDIEGANFTV